MIGRTAELPVLLLISLVAVVLISAILVPGERTEAAAPKRITVVTTVVSTMPFLEAASEIVQQIIPGLEVTLRPIPDPDHAVLQIIGLGERPDVVIIPRARFAQYACFGP